MLWGKMRTFWPQQNKMSFFTKNNGRPFLHKGFGKGRFGTKKNQMNSREMLTISALKIDKLVSHYVYIFSEITESKRVQEQLEIRANYDLLTSLPNRTLFSKLFSNAMARANKGDKKLALCFLDLDGFKKVNDKFGHGIGDLLLAEIANRLTNATRQKDTVSRQGGDEFAFFLRISGDFRNAKKSSNEFTS